MLCSRHLALQKSSRSVSRHIKMSDFSEICLKQRIFSGKKIWRFSLQTAISILAKLKKNERMRAATLNSCQKKIFTANIFPITFCKSFGYCQIKFSKVPETVLQSSKFMVFPKFFRCTDSNLLDFSRKI